MKTQELYEALNSLPNNSVFNAEISSITSTQFPGNVFREVTQTVQLGFESCPIFQKWTFQSYLKTPNFRSTRGYIFQSPFLARCESDFESIYIRFAPVTILEECFRDEHGAIVPRSKLTKFQTLIQRRVFDSPYPRKMEKPLWMVTNLRHILTAQFLDGPLADWTYENDEL